MGTYFRISPDAGTHLSDVKSRTAGERSSAGALTTTASPWGDDTMSKPTLLPVRTPARAATLQRWHNTNRGLIQRTLDGLRALDHPAGCRPDNPINSYAHAHQILAVHAKHRACPRYAAALTYTQAARP